LNAKEAGLFKRTEKLLGKETKSMDWLDIIAELVEIAETQENLIELFIMEEKIDE
jgi:hypothetical protein